jgi:diketogulonate reductase-like aldo/keto reductase
MLSVRFALMLALAAASQDEPTTVEISKGVFMPRVNLGTCCGSDPAIGVPAWFAAGGVGIDTAWDYADEPVIAQQLKASGKKRSDFFVTTKIPAGVGARMTGNKTDCLADPNISLNYLKDNLRQLDLKYVDLVLLHGPCRFAPYPVPDATASDNALWKGLQMALEMGLTRAIGVSNYNSSELAALTDHVPSVNQVQMSVGPDNNHSKGWPMPPIAHDDATIAYCLANNITYEAWRVIGGCPFSNPQLNAIAKAHTVEASQICFRWVLQRGAVIAAGTGGDASKVKEYSAENLAVFNFTLTDAEMKTLNEISPP